MRKLFLFAKNVWRFRKELSSFQGWDYSFYLSFNSAMLKEMAKEHDNGLAVRSPQTAKELRIASELCRRASEEAYDETYLTNRLESKVDCLSSKAAIKLARKQQQQDIDYLCKLISRKLTTWWD